MHVEKINEKHDVGLKKSIMIQNIPIVDESDQAIWNYITDSGTNFNLQPVFEVFGAYSQRNRINLSRSLTSAFKTDLTDGNEVFRGAGIPPHVLRHLRVYNLKFNRGYDLDFIQALLGWKKKDMFEHYVYISKMLRDKEQLQVLERSFDDFNRQGLQKLTLGSQFTPE